MENGEIEMIGITGPSSQERTGNGDKTKTDKGRREDTTGIDLTRMVLEGKSRSSWNLTVGRKQREADSQALLGKGLQGLVW